MKIVPQVVHKFESNAEKRVFDLLQNVDLGAGAVALHSLNLREHEYKQWAEADFVIIGAGGVLVLEIKGGGVSCDDNGVWVFTNRFGREFRKSESPFDQARTARFSLEKLLLEKAGESLVQRVNFGWGCIFPDVRFQGVDTVEIDDSMIIDSKLRTSKDLQQWLQSLYSYWQRKTKKQQQLSVDEIATLAKNMRPSFDLVPPLRVRVRNVLENQLTLTNAQYSALDFSMANPRAVVMGGAGTGKTVLAMEACRRIAFTGGSPLLICRNKMLADVFKRELEGWNITAMHLDSMIDAEERGFVPRFTHLVIDEGQDFLELNIAMKLDEMIPGGISDGKWIKFMDVNNQGSMYGSIDESVLELFTSSAAKCPLIKNIRNTPEICRHLSWYTGVAEPDIGELGLAVKVNDDEIYESREELAEFVEKQLEEWLDNDGFEPSEITILSPCIQSESIIPFLSTRWKRRIRTLSESSTSVLTSSTINFSQIRDFKGLDSPLVLLVDLEFLDEEDKGIVQLYVGMSRANAVLVMPIPQSRRKEFKRKRKQFESSNN